MTEERVFRLQTIDNLFQKGNTWTQSNLLKELNKEYRKTYSKKIQLRMFQEDLKYLEEKLNAPIQRVRGEGRKFIFSYKNSDFALKNENFDEKSKAILQEATTLLRQFEGLPHFESMTETLAQLHCWTDEKAASLILFEKNEYKGSEYIKVLYDAILDKKEILLDYTPFDKNFEKRLLQPYILKEFRNRWYVFGWENAHQRITSAALDRIKKVEVLTTKFTKIEDDFNPSTFFNDVIGVTVFKDAATEKVTFRVHESSAKYLETKKLHQSQERLYKDGDWTHFSLQVKINYELEAELRRFGAALEVLEPAHLREKFKVEAEKLAKLYQQ